MGMKRTKHAFKKGNSRDKQLFMNTVRSVQKRGFFNGCHCEYSLALEKSFSNQGIATGFDKKLREAKNLPA